MEIRNMIKSVIFDIDGTLLDTEYAVLNSLRDTIWELKNENIELSDLTFALGIPGEIALKQLGITDTQNGNIIWNACLANYSHTIRLFDGIAETLKELKNQGYKLGVITSKSREEYETDFSPFSLDGYFDTIVCVGDSDRPKPSPDPMLKYLELSGTKKEEAIYIGDTAYDMQCASKAGVAFGLASWGCHCLNNIQADYYFNRPTDILQVLSLNRNKQEGMPWIKLAVELQFLAQGGLCYSKDIFDIERFERIREISAEMMTFVSGYSLDHVKSVFCNETGFQTPKLDTRAAVFQNEKILLVEEKNGTWSLPGGWVDVYESIKTNIIKEVKEEAGLDVIPVKLIAVQDRKLHNQPEYAYGVTKAFVLCKVLGGKFKANIETINSGYFGLYELPLLAEEKNNAEQIKMCFDAYYNENWETVFD